MRLAGRLAACARPCAAHRAVHTASLLRVWLCAAGCPRPFVPFLSLPSVVNAGLVACALEVWRRGCGLCGAIRWVHAGFGALAALLVLLCCDGARAAASTS